MYCPRCGQERTSQVTSFCSRCGFLLTSVSELLLSGGTATKEEGESPRSRGIRIGIFLLLLLIVVAPILGIISVFLLRMPPWPMGIAIFLMGGGGILRIAYALMFESNVRKPPRDEQEKNVGAAVRMFGEPPPVGSLPPQRDEPVSAYSPPDAGGWLETSDLKPASVTDHTTKLLEKDQ